MALLIDFQQFFFFDASLFIWLMPLKQMKTLQSFTDHIHFYTQLE